jgi:hypothetical protein
MRKEYDTHLNTSDKGFSSLSTNSEYIITQSKGNLKRSSTHESLGAAVAEKAMEVEALSEITTELKSRRPTYVPVKEDPVDIALASYVNNREEALAVPFKREDFEIYHFGTKRIFVKMENGKIIIRVGGGFMLIDEFIEIYTPIELEKSEARLIETNPAYRKVVGKILGQSIREPMSPQKAAKIIHSAV